MMKPDLAGSNYWSISDELSMKNKTEEKRDRKGLKRRKGPVICRKLVFLCEMHVTQSGLECYLYVICRISLLTIATSEE